MKNNKQKTKFRIVKVVNSFKPNEAEYRIEKRTIFGWIPFFGIFKKYDSTFNSLDAALHDLKSQTRYIISEEIVYEQ